MYFGNSIYTISILQVTIHPSNPHVGPAAQKGRLTSVRQLPLPAEAEQYNPPALTSAHPLSACVALAGPCSVSSLFSPPLLSLLVPLQGFALGLRLRSAGLEPYRLTAASGLPAQPVRLVLHFGGWPPGQTSMPNTSNNECCSSNIECHHRNPTNRNKIKN
jgi:hypothetical protein